MTLRRTPLGYDALRVYARVLRDHTPYFDFEFEALHCSADDHDQPISNEPWPCPDWTQASEALDG